MTTTQRKVSFSDAEWDGNKNGTGNQIAIALDDLSSGLADMISGLRLSEADLPDDFEWLVARLEKARTVLATGPPDSASDSNLIRAALGLPPLVRGGSVKGREIKVSP